MGLALIWSPGAVRNPPPLSLLRLKPAEVIVPSKLLKAVKANRQLPNVIFAVEPPFWIPTEGRKLFMLFEPLPTKVQLFIVTIALPAADPKFEMPPPEAWGTPPPPAPPLPELAEVALL